MPCSKTRAPIGEQGEKVEDADVAITVEVRRARWVATPRRQQRQKIKDADAAILIEIGRARRIAGSIKEVCRAGVVAVVVVSPGPDDCDFLSR